MRDFVYAPNKCKWPITHWKLKNDQLIYHKASDEFTLSYQWTDYAKVVRNERNRWEVVDLDLRLSQIGFVSQAHNAALRRVKWARELFNV